MKRGDDAVENKEHFLFSKGPLSRRARHAVPTSGRTCPIGNFPQPLSKCSESITAFEFLSRCPPIGLLQYSACLPTCPYLSFHIMAQCPSMLKSSLVGGTNIDWRVPAVLFYRGAWYVHFARHRALASGGNKCTHEATQTAKFGSRRLLNSYLPGYEGQTVIDTASSYAQNRNCVLFILTSVLQGRRTSLISTGSRNSNRIAKHQPVHRPPEMLT